jgi:hypothetical protein
LFSERRVGDLFDPALKKKKKDLEKHHIFPKNYLVSTFKLDRRQINQVANFTYLEFEDNIEISDSSPRDYFTAIKKSNYAGKESELNAILSSHCLPENFYDMNYDDFLKARRKLMAGAIRASFESL